MSLDMSGHVDDTFKSADVWRVPVGGDYDDTGIYQPTEGEKVRFDANVQPLNDRQFQRMKEGNKRIVDARVIRINDGDLASIELTDDWEMDAGYGLKRWITKSLDNRPWRNYCKITVVRYDDQ
jgi:hypothetical protein